ncbi:MAG TPA: hypothetical protein VN635_15060 [Conexibacter sp.]|nr:hypothetical protein [Conexibacter sp.]
MPRRVPLLALPLGFLVALAVAACGSGGSKDSATTVPPLSATTEASTPTIATTTVTTATQPTTVTTTTTTQTTTRPSGGAAPSNPAASGGAPAGCPSAVGNFIRDVRATDCSVARSVADAWFAAVHAGARPDGPIQADGYSCTGAMAGEQASVSCTAGGGSVAFTASP